MCTLSWAIRGASYDVLFSRDERRTRLPAEPPRADAVDGVRFLAPRDGDFGGTWLLANERGVTVCMLNLYAGADGPREGRAAAEYTSRGRLVLGAAAAGSGREAAGLLAGAPLPDYRPFSAVAFGPGEPPRLVEWDGRRVVARDLGDDDLPFASSGYDADGARRTRRAAFERLRAGAAPPADAGALERFHRSHEPAPGPFSVCMHRDDAVTVSLARVAVGPDAVTLWYAGGSPCATPFGAPLRLARR